ncbi:TetR/AcrR family transcriptional regulator [Thioclava sp. FTW29]|uniref:TetR/AcrR family transcriptional regulator n=1 Tax=Thioclava litoralis TaxID=3076557 RepID=A0ABZ1E6R8_9RHOB|nr:TetR/AcrR family transcriptional regulator [Thioclava sp. FTW29]
MNKDAKREDLKQRLITAAEDQIREHGLGGLKARAVTAQAGCALGALYNAVEDLDMLVLHVNSKTLARLGQELAQAVRPDMTAKAALLALAHAYVAFATQNERLWIALFEHRLPEGRDIPDWHKQDHEQLIAQINGPLSQLVPGLSGDQLSMRGRTLFAAVQGVVHLSFKGRFVGVPREHLQSEVAALVTALVG